MGKILQLRDIAVKKRLRYGLIVDRVLKKLIQPFCLGGWENVKAEV